METVKNVLLGLPFIKGPYDYISSIETHMDYEGQRKAERIYQVIITLFGIVGFIWGFTIQQLSATVYIVLGGFALSCLIVLPPWPFFRRDPLPWQPIEKEKPSKKNESKKK
ncbi:signal peptidase complex subunit 1-like [Hydractinia symbiolongicarpus]|uniref:signal peptidase complex subunit 1-like n=1 Tax=Hydractinia symbiolongicarpus TaxID=13093 RepID=UPI00254FE6D5|nr:signal peptidase complex subunit 1-like [Hydractinia symbiolongicarpus]